MFWAVKLSLTIFLIVCSITDIRKRIVYLKVLLPFAIIAICIQIFFRGRGIFDIAGGILVGLAMLGLNMLSHGDVGAGDALVLMVTGCFLGLYGNIRLLMGALFFASIFSIVMLLLKRCDRKTPLPFMPFLLASYLFL